MAPAKTKTAKAGKNKDTASTVDNPEASFDELVGRLRDVVDQLEKGNLNLEDSLKSYEEGVGLARRGHALLDAAEKRVELLVKDGAEPLDLVEATDRGPDTAADD